MESVPLWLPVAFFAIALLYASAGFGGGSAYLAAMALVGMPHAVIPQISLLCNTCVTAGGVWHFGRGGHLDLRRVLPFFVLSVPMAYLGGRVEIGRQSFYVLVGLMLALAGGRMLIPTIREKRRGISGRNQWLLGVPAGAVLGFLSGIAGIGGGVFLAPVLLLTGWTTAKQTAAAASLFILVNSVAGLAGHLVKGVQIGFMALPLVAAAVIGGQIGSRMGSYNLSSRVVRVILAAVILVVGIRLLWKAI